MCISSRKRCRYYISVVANLCVQEFLNYQLYWTIATNDRREIFHMLIFRVLLYLSICNTNLNFNIQSSFISRLLFFSTHLRVFLHSPKIFLLQIKELNQYYKGRIRVLMSSFFLFKNCCRYNKMQVVHDQCSCLLKYQRENRKKRNTLKNVFLFLLLFLFFQCYYWLLTSGPGRIN